MARFSRISTTVAALGWLAACPAGDGARTQEERLDVDAAPVPVTPDAGPAPRCAHADPSLRVPAGFCASVFAEHVGPARQKIVTPAGDLYVAVADAPDGTPGGVRVLRDTDSDGVADIQEQFGEAGGSGLAWQAGILYFAQDDRIVRWELANLPDGEIAPHGGPALLVSGLPGGGEHPAKTLAFDAQGMLLVSIGSATNSCQLANRTPHSPGVDPCPELDTRAGVWRCDPVDEEQTQADCQRLATGLRESAALAVAPDTGTILGGVAGRDDLYESWPELRRGSE
jgi:glucose/arabinose dehydrogenase